MASRGREDRGQDQGRGYSPWPGDRSQGPRDEDDHPQQGMGGGSVYEEGRGYGQAHGGYGSPEAGGFGGQTGYGRQGEYQAGSRRDYGGGPGGGYKEQGFGSGGYGQRERQQQYGRGEQPAYGVGFGGGEPGYGGYPQGREYAQPREQEYQGGGHETQYTQGGYRGGWQHRYGQGREPASGPYGGAGLGGYSEGSSDIGRGLASAFGYGEQAAYGQAGYGRPEQGATIERRRGGFRGRGPKGYQRPDERISEEVCQFLCDDDDLDASDIEVVVANGEVTLSGTVPDRPSKRRAEDDAERISGVQHVQNNLRVNREGQTQQAGSTEPQAARARARSPR